MLVCVCFVFSSSRLVLVLYDFIKVSTVNHFAVWHGWLQVETSDALLSFCFQMALGILTVSELPHSLYAVEEVSEITPSVLPTFWLFTLLHHFTCAFFMLISISEVVGEYVICCCIFFIILITLSQLWHTGTVLVGKAAHLLALLNLHVARISCTANSLAVQCTLCRAKFISRSGAHTFAFVLLAQLFVPEKTYSSSIHTQRHWCLTTHVLFSYHVSHDMNNSWSITGSNRQPPAFSIVCM